MKSRWPAVVSLLTQCFLITHLAQAQSKKSCSALLESVNSVALSQIEAADLRRLHTAAKAAVFQKLLGSWVEVNTYNGTPAMGEVDQKVVPHMIKLQEIREPAPQRAILYGVSGTLRNEDGSLTEVHEKIPFENISSVRLIEKKDMIVSLLPVYKPNGRPNLNLSKTLNEKILTMAEGNKAALMILMEMMSAEPLKYDKMPVSMEELIRTLDAENMRGRQIVAAYKYYANKSILRLMFGIIEDPTVMTDAVNSVLNPQDKRESNIDHPNLPQRYRYRAVVPPMMPLTAMRNRSL